LKESKVATEPLLLYSTNTWLAYTISQIYYREEHFVWCSPYFSSLSLPACDQTSRPSSTPGKIYTLLYEEVLSGERHSDKIRHNKAGIRRGANYKKQAGIITEDQKLDIYAAVKKAQVVDYRPIIYVIPFSLVANMAVEVPVRERAHPLSREYRIERLPRRCFDVISIHGSRSEL
jgi:hypothetical protein